MKFTGRRAQNERALQIAGFNGEKIEKPVNKTVFYGAERRKEIGRGYGFVS